jgi:hypothetical protein
VKLKEPTCGALIVFGFYAAQLIIFGGLALVAMVAQMGHD